MGGPTGNHVPSGHHASGHVGGPNLSREDGEQMMIGEDGEDDFMIGEDGEDDFLINQAPVFNLK